MNLKSRAHQLKTDIPAVFICLKSKDTPIVAKVFAALTIAYALSPIDLIPDFIHVLGYLDDLIILPLLIALTIKFIPRDVFEKYRVEAEGMWKDGKPKKWYYYIDGIIAPDGEEQDAYIIGIDKQVKEFTGRVIAIIHRFDDVEEKWLVAPENSHFTREQVMESVKFQEQYFKSEIIM